MRKNSLALVGLFVLSIGTIVGCGGTEQEVNTAPIEQSNQSQQQSYEEAMKAQGNNARPGN